jgi:hypothetical protein
VHQEVFASVCGRYEAKAFALVEPFDLAFQFVMVECTAAVVWRVRCRERTVLQGLGEGWRAKVGNRYCAGGCIDGRETATSSNIYILVGVSGSKVKELVRVGA